MAPAAGAEQRLKELGLVLPSPPTPLGAYADAVRSGHLVFLSGMLPAVDGKPQFIGRVAGELSLEDGRKAATTATLNALSAAKDLLGSLDHVTRVARLGVFIATEGDFRGHPKVADAASEVLASVFGADKLASRVVLGVASLPSACRSNWSLISKSSFRLGDSGQLAHENDEFNQQLAVIHYDQQMMQQPAGPARSLNPAFAGAAATFSGIGLARFAYVPLFPAMVAAGWVTGPEGGFLGAMNLAGYLMGVLGGRGLAARLGTARALDAGMALVGLAFAGTQALLGSRSGDYSLAWQEEP